MHKKHCTITIDGPAGAGKGVVSSLLARRLGFTRLDTGAMYRAVSLHALKQGFELSGNIAKKHSEDRLQLLLAGIEIEMDEKWVWLNGKEVSQAIRTPEVGMAASFISQFAYVRQKLTELQRKIAQSTDLVAEGRDMGTVVFPDAQCKFFLTAKPEIRAQRRWLQLREQGIEKTLEEVLKEIQERDRADSSREIAPLKMAPDAILVDSSYMGVEEVVNTMYEHARQRMANFSTLS
jgi:cytidylate kinase